VTFTRSRLSGSRASEIVVSETKYILYTTGDSSEVNLVDDYWFSSSRDPRRCSRPKSFANTFISAYSSHASKYYCNLSVCDDRDLWDFFLFAHVADDSVLQDC